jgi:hypothetical protein
VAGKSRLISGAEARAAAFEKTPRPAAEPVGAFAFGGASHAERNRPDATRKQKGALLMGKRL